MAWLWPLGCILKKNTQNLFWWIYLLAIHPIYQLHSTTAVLNITLPSNTMTSRYCSWKKCLYVNGYLFRLRLFRNWVSSMSSRYIYNQIVDSSRLGGIRWVEDQLSLLDRQLLIRIQFLPKFSRLCFLINIVSRIDYIWSLKYPIRPLQRKSTQ